MSRVSVRPVYNCRLRSLRGYDWGVFAGDECVAIFPKYPTKLMREIRA